MSISTRASMSLDVRLQLFDVVHAVHIYIHIMY